MEMGLRFTPFQPANTKSELLQEPHPTIKLVPKCVQTEGNVSLLGKQLERCAFTADDVFITIKTTQRNHKSRVLILLLTWLQTVRPEQVILQFMYHTYQ